MDFLQPFLQHVVRQSKPKLQQYVYRDDLKKKKTSTLKVKKKVHFESKPLIQRDETKKISETENSKDGVSRDEEKSAVQVKILMTKEEAARLLSKCKNGGVLQFEDVPNLLVHIPNNRVDAFSSNKKDK